MTFCNLKLCLWVTSIHEALARKKTMSQVFTLYTFKQSILYFNRIPFTIFNCKSCIWFTRLFNHQNDYKNLFAYWPVTLSSYLYIHTEYKRRGSCLALSCLLIRLRDTRAAFPAIPSGMYILALYICTPTKIERLLVLRLKTFTTYINISFTNEM